MKGRSRDIYGAGEGTASPGIPPSLPDSVGVVPRLAPTRAHPPPNDESRSYALPFRSLIMTLTGPLYNPSRLNAVSIYLT